MDPLAEVTAAEVTLELGDRTWRLSPLRVKDYAEIRRVIASGRTSPIELAMQHIESVPESLRGELLARAWEDEKSRDHVSDVEAAQWLTSTEGVVYSFYLMLRRNHPQMTPQRAEELLLAHRDQLDAIRSRLQQSSGMPSGN